MIITLLLLGLDIISQRSFGENSPQRPKPYGLDMTAGPAPQLSV